MRISKYVPVLAAILPLALAQYSTSPPPTTSTCSVDVYQCSGNTFQKCGADGTWQDIAKCSMAAHCSAQYSVTAGHGGCLLDANVSNSTMQCSVIAERRCDMKNNLQECADDGQWGTIKNCTKTALCSAEKTATDNGGCYPVDADSKLIDNECFEIGLSRCAFGKNALETCDAIGHWKTVKQCKQGETCQVNSKFVDGGQCIPPSYAPPPKEDDNGKCTTVNEFRCKNNALEKCNSDHSWHIIKQCKEGETCKVNSKFFDGGQCLPPSPPSSSMPSPSKPTPTAPKIIEGDKCPEINAYRCNNNVLENCDNAGLRPTGHWKKVKQCLKSEICMVNEKSFEGVCVPAYVLSNPYPAPPAETSPAPPKECSPTLPTPTAPKESSSTPPDPSPTVPAEPSPAPPMGDEPCKTNQARCNENMIQTCLTGQLWSGGSSCGKHRVCVDNCGQKGCKPYCMDEDAYNTVVGDNNSSAIDAAPVTKRSELEACDRSGLERCVYEAPVRTQSCTNGTWVDKEICPANSICWAYNDGDETAECAPMPEFPPQVNKARSDSCDCPGLERCMYDAPIRTQSCTNGTWTDKKICPRNTICWVDNDGNETAECVPSPGLPPQALNARSKPESCDRPGLERCMYDTPVRAQSCTNGTWTDKEICPEMTVCWADNDGTEAAECLPKPGLPPHARALSLSARGDWPSEPCRPGHSNCDSDRYSLLVCSADKKWQFSKKCLAPGGCKRDGPGQADCRNGEMNPPKIKTRSTKPCHPGDTNCDTNFASLLVCNADKKCRAPGDCKVDGPGHAHCKNGEMDPPKAKRSECNSGDRACDKDRRFLFTCNEGGHWDEGFQCFRDGYCRPDSSSPLTCAGWPLFDGNDGACKSACEGLYYLYCIGVSLRSVEMLGLQRLMFEQDNWKKPEKVEECRRNMCTEKEVSAQLCR